MHCLGSKSGLSPLTPQTSSTRWTEESALHMRRSLEHEVRKGVNSWCNYQKEQSTNWRLEQEWEKIARKNGDVDVWSSKGTIRSRSRGQTRMLHPLHSNLIFIFQFNYKILQYCALFDLVLGTLAPRCPPPPPSLRHCIRSSTIMSVQKINRLANSILLSCYSQFEISFERPRD